MKTFTFDINGIAKERLVNTIMQAKGTVLVINEAEQTTIMIDENKDQAYVEKIVNENYNKDIKLNITKKDVWRFWTLMVRQAA